jgi:osmotically-inducible protein OsmY
MSNDNQIQQDVLAELKWEPSVNSAHVGVTAKNGVVTLSGHVENYMSKYAAERAARRVQGVQGVAEEIEVHLPFDNKKMTKSPPPFSTDWRGTS